MKHTTAPNRFIKVGDIRTSNKYGDYRVDKIDKHGRVQITFLHTDFELNTNLAQVKRGSVIDHSVPSVYGVGYCTQKGLPTTHPVAYQLWRGVLKRCYEHKNTHRVPTYKNTTVANEWHDFSVYLAWHQDNYIKGYVLDKDLLGYKEKQYSPKTCVFLPPKINLFITPILPDKIPAHLGSHQPNGIGRYQSYCKDLNNKKQYLGLYDTSIEAHAAYLTFKADLLLKLIAKYPKISNTAIKALNALHKKITNRILDIN